MFISDKRLIKSGSPNHCHIGLVFRLSQLQKNMKAIFTLLIAFCLSANLLSQEAAGCDDWRVEEIYIDTPGQLAVTISNSCSDCLSGLQSCVYYELQVSRTVFPFDTVAASGCWCLIGPANESSETYLINTTLSSLPPISQLKVSLLCGAESCDSIPLSSALGTLTNSQIRSVKVYPNPAGDFLIISSTRSEKLTARIVDIVGRERMIKTVQADRDQINISQLPSGIFLIEISDEFNKPIKTLKIRKA